MNSNLSTEHTENLRGVKDMPYGVVKEIHKDSAVVIMERQDMCGDCHACEMLSGKKACTLTCLNHIKCNVGDRVEVTLTNEHFLKATYLVYGVPLIGFVIGILIGYGLAQLLTFGEEDIFVAIGAILGTLIGIGYIKWRDKQESYHKFLPHIVKKEV